MVAGQAATFAEEIVRVLLKQKSLVVTIFSSVAVERNVAGEF
jgi:hypothetical protein